MLLYKQIINKEEKIALIGLGYVGMPIAVAFAAKGIEVIGFDSNKAKIELYKSSAVLILRLVILLSALILVTKYTDWRIFIRLFLVWMQSLLMK